MPIIVLNVQQDVKPNWSAITLLLSGFNVVIWLAVGRILGRYFIIVVVVYPVLFYYYFLLQIGLMMLMKIHYIFLVQQK